MPRAPESPSPSAVAQPIASHRPPEQSSPFAPPSPSSLLLPRLLNPHRIPAVAPIPPHTAAHSRSSSAPFRDHKLPQQEFRAADALPQPVQSSTVTRSAHPSPLPARPRPTRARHPASSPHTDDMLPSTAPGTTLVLPEPSPPRGAPVSHRGRWRLPAAVHIIPPYLSCLAHAHAPLVSTMDVSPAPPPAHSTAQRVPLDIWCLVLALLPPRLAWRARLTCTAWQHLVEDHLARLWFRRACVEVKWAPFFRIYDCPSSAIRDPYPVRGVRGGWAGFERPETGELEAGAWGAWGPSASASAWEKAGGTSTPGRRANLTKSLWLHKEVTVSLALAGEVSQPIKLRLKIRPTNADPEEEADSEQQRAASPESRSGSLSPSPSPSSSPEPEDAWTRKTMYLSANGRRIRFDWKLLMERASRQGNWSDLSK
ncbi:hypothetical protein CALCODRAFT_352987 [Calocera cornea HHB12733]|uniref:F-box domain-containing protein n=1 Tax=Calocera cornea HHB12733 TaxID=1353952 RepID=A0A165ETI4_9BASI|nr:hypothetical protein CALCODRAFT_352987 [Calocera cornea HHB12733]